MRSKLLSSALLAGSLAIAPALSQGGNICPPWFGGGSGNGGPGTGSGGPGNGGPGTGNGSGETRGTGAAIRSGGRNAVNPPVGGPASGGGNGGGPRTGEPGSGPSTNPGYRGPGDRPPGSSGPSSGGGGSGGSGPASPEPYRGPSDLTPGPGSGAGGGPSSGPSTGPNGGRGPSGQPGGPTTRVGLDLSLPLDAWDRWWAANRERFLDLRAHVEQTVDGPTTGDGDQRGIDPRGLTTELRARVAEHLLAVLEGKVAASSTEVDAALLAAAKLGAERSRTREALQAHLRAGAQSTRELAALSLGLLGDPGCAPPLLALARDLPLAHALCGSTSIDARTRAFAIYGLGLLGRRQGAGSVTLGLAREALVELAQQQAPLDITVAALSALSILPLGENERWLHGYPVLERILLERGASDFLRAHVPTSVARLGGKPWAERLALVAENDAEHPLVRASALLAFGRFGDELPPALRARALKAIEKARQRTDGFSERSFATLAQARMGDAESVKRFEKEVVSGAHLDQPWVALGLGLAAREEAAAGKDIASRVDALRRAFRSAKAPETRGALAIALGLTRNPDAIADVRKAFEQERIGRTRGHLAVALGLLGDRSALPQLRAAIQEQGREPEEIAELANALGMLRDNAAVPLLVEQLKSARSVAELGPLARALGRIGDAEAVEALLALARESSSGQLTRTYALAGLGVLFDAGPLPWSVPYTEDLNYLAATPSLFASGGLLDLL